MNNWAPTRLGRRGIPSSGNPMAFIGLGLAISKKLKTEKLKAKS
jgi:hypothetical protein